MKHKLKCESQTSWWGIFTCPWKYSAPVLTPACIIAMSCPVISANNTSTSSSLLLSCDNSFHRSAPPSTYCPHFSQWGLQNDNKREERVKLKKIRGARFRWHMFEDRYFRKVASFGSWSNRQSGTQGFSSRSLNYWLEPLHHPCSVVRSFVLSNNNAKGTGRPSAYYGD